LLLDILGPDGTRQRARLLVGDGNGPFRPGTLLLGTSGVEIVMQEAGTPTPQQTARPSCDALSALARKLDRYGTEAEIGLRGIYIDAGLYGGGEETEAKCAVALSMMRERERELAATFGGEGSPECHTLARTEDGVVAELRRLGMAESGTLDVIRQQNGLPGGGQAGRYTAASCANADRAMQAYLADLRREAPAPAPSSDLVARFPVESLRDQNDDGVWRPSYGGEALSFWNHNGSDMAWESGPGSRRVVWYWRPREGLRGVGVTPGTLLFEGERVGDRMRGTARLFKADCGVFPYRVEGPIAPGDKRVTMTGTAPRIAPTCEIVGTFEDTLVFDFVAMQPTGPVPEPEDETLYDTPGIGVFAGTYRVDGVGASDVLNVRAGPSAREARLAALPPNAGGILVVRGCAPEIPSLAWEESGYEARVRMLRGAWCHVAWRDVEGWVSGQFLRPE
ncbi:MAG: hypothetical protein AAF321_12770, partial [Pseudomonadota bacterium]